MTQSQRTDRSRDPDEAAPPDEHMETQRTDRSSDPDEAAPSDEHMENNRTDRSRLPEGVAPPREHMETKPTELWRSEDGAPPAPERDHLASEEPLEIRVDGRAVSVTMRTPGLDRELATGFLLSEGLIRRAEDVRSVAPLTDEGACNVVNVDLADGVTVDFDRLTRHVFASSSCGLCGKVTIDSVHQQFPPIESDLSVASDLLLELPQRARSAQVAFDRSGGLHAAAIFGERGDLVVLCEDVGRHNAVDKVLGSGLLSGKAPFDRHVLLVSGRSSFEIMQKALAGQIPIVAAVSAPSTLAVEFARSSGQTLVGFLRSRRMNVYTGRQRIRFRDQ